MVMEQFCSTRSNLAAQWDIVISNPGSPGFTSNSRIPFKASFPRVV